MMPRAATLASDFPVRRLQDLEVEAGLLPSVLSRKGSRNLGPHPTFELRGRRIGDAQLLTPSN